MKHVIICTIICTISRLGLRILRILCIFVTVTVVSSGVLSAVSDEELRAVVDRLGTVENCLADVLAKGKRYLFFFIK